MHEIAIVHSDGSLASTVLHGDMCVKVMQFCDWRSRAFLSSLNRSSLSSFAAQDAYWEMMCKRLSEETLIFCPSTMCCSNSWRQLFLELFPSRALFTSHSDLSSASLSPAVDLLAMVDRQLGGDEVLTDEEEKLSRELIASRLKLNAAKPKTFEIKVCARMKPLPSQNGKSTQQNTNTDMGVSVVLPLHQRLQLIRSERKCSLKEARRILWQGSACNDPWADSAAKVRSIPEADENTPANKDPLVCEEKDSIAVDDEDAKVQACVVAVTAGLEGAVLMCCPGTGLREFKFDAVLGEDSTQHQVYEAAPRRLVIDFINGKNASLFAYGQTGSGKTHTIFGPNREAGAHVMLLDAESILSCSGIVPRACSDVLTAIHQRRAQGVRAVLRISYVEIYGEQVTDLLNDNAAVGQWQGVAHRAVFSGECAVEVENGEHLRELLLKADDSKSRASTAMNARSSRAHCLLMLSLTQQKAQRGASGTEIESFLAIADLGGSEQVLKSGVASLSVQAGGYLQADIRLKEAVNINLGLLALKTVIRHLVDKSDYVPYQNSRLTMMLSAVLASQSRTVVVVTGSSERRNALETMLTLRFGEECAQVVQTDRNSIAAAARAISALDLEIHAVEASIRSKERWETVRTTREDDLHQADEATQATETVVTTRLVGAERERAKLEQLLSRRRILTGL